VPIDLALRILREYREVDPDGRVAVREIAIILLAGALLATACASGGGAASESPQSRSAEVIEVSATEYAFSVPPEVRGGVVAMRFTNTGSLPHEFAFGRIDPGRGLEDLRAFVESGEEPPDWMHDVAGVPALSPGRSVTVTRTLAPGTYTFLCYLPSPDGTPHVKLGMFATFEIVGETGAALPPADLVISAGGDGLSVPEILPACRPSSSATRGRANTAS
jgi:uncharacterized cupredoxin-like copper-binding protein